jgi:hypothetical protein
MELTCKSFRLTPLWLISLRNNLAFLLLHRATAARDLLGLEAVETVLSTTNHQTATSHQSPITTIEDKRTQVSSTGCGSF